MINISKKTTVVEQIQVTKEMAILLDELLSIFKHEPLFAYNMRRDEIHKTFYNPNTFFEAWYCGYYYFEHTNDLSLF